MDVGQGPNWGCSAKEKKMTYAYPVSEFAALAKEGSPQHNWSIFKVNTGPRVAHGLANTLYLYG
jgi:hypothetical protein